jgi:hypothetical protein
MTPETRIVSRLSRDFDVEKGHQSPWTGFLGALFLLSLFAGYNVWGIYELAGAGPQVALLFSILPARFQIHDVNRNLLDLLLMVGLLFQFMATSEVLRASDASRSRGALGVVAACGVVAVWTCPPLLHDVGGALVTSMEIRLIGIGVAMLAAGLLGRWERKGADRRARGVKWSRALRSGCIRWLCLYLLFTAAWLVYVTIPYYVHSQSPSFTNWRITVTLLWSLFGLFGLPYAVWTVRVRRDRVHDFLDPGLLLFLVYRRLFLAVARGEFSKLRRLRNRRVRITLLDLLVKAFFMPLMVTFLFIEAGNFAGHMIQLVETQGDGWRAFYTDPFWKALYGILRDSLYVIDVSIGLLGYACSFWWLGNKSKSVESTFGGWLAALACYPPLSLLTIALLPFDENPGPAWEIFQVAGVQNALLVVALLGNAIYVWATLAFGLRFSNLTNRGIITRGPYRFVRHPAYAAKVVAWWCEAVPVFGSFSQLLFFSGWVGIYFLRALTEERHLKADPSYLAYCAAVRHRFVPGIW